MPGGQHERVICNFRTTLLSNFNFIGLSLRKADFTGHRAERTPELYIKEPVSPYDARVNSAADEYPSLVLEVEASEPPDQLRQDAPRNQTRVDRRDNRRSAPRGFEV
ncbi:hypothetical protein N7449_012383 [Penicillium cf. viridicatum]|uniref:Restriction endonuclease domain-containing protein n=1 Tax=Penicillium cf. viridicatum TaxID=2972119 RepID=A0A9W9IUQ3_9EURO|nr:hypothetical protein N7449_012383 [Penicillium cf. viridicatum]